MSNLILDELFDNIYPNFSISIDNKKLYINPIYSKNLCEKIELHNILNLNMELIKQFVLVIISKNDNLFLHIFHKEYNKKIKNFEPSKCLYKCTIILSNTEELLDIYNYKIVEKQSDNFFPRLTELPLDIYSSLYNVFENDLQHLEVLNNVQNINSTYLYQQLYHLNSGIKFNVNDIRWQIILSSLITSNIGYNGKIVDIFRSTMFKHQNIKTSYYPNFMDISPYESYYMHNLKIVCDKCNKDISYDTNSLFWHSPFCGDLCNLCYKEKKSLEIKRRNQIIKRILLEGKKVIFKKIYNLLKVKLENIKLPNVSIIKRNQILNNMNVELLKINNNKKICSICFDYLVDNIGAGYCGHCFHYKCLENVPNVCPICRTDTKFIKLFF